MTPKEVLAFNRSDLPKGIAPSFDAPFIDLVQPCVSHGSIWARFAHRFWSWVEDTPKEEARAFDRVL